MLRNVPSPPLRGGALARFAKQNGGGIAVIFALSSAVLVAVTGGAIDLATQVNERARLQVAADQSALLIAREMRVSPALHAAATGGEGRGEASEGATRRIVRAQLERAGFHDDTVEIGVDFDPQRNATTVELSMIGSATLTRIIGMTPRIAVAATAATRGLPICVIALGREERVALGLADRAHVRASGCAVHANSSAARSIEIDTTSDIDAGLLCSAGGVSGRRPARARTDCPALEDPFAGRPPPTLRERCDHTDAVFNGDGFLSPGIYCGRTVIRHRRKLTPGMYVFRDGDLIVEHPGNGEAALLGRDVVLVFDNPNREARVRLAPTATVDLEGAVGDPQLAGFLLYQVPGSRRLTVSIESRRARNVVGTVYLPNGELDISSDRPVADRSAYTILVADEVRVRGGPTLTLNTDFHATDVPVPRGVGPGEIGIVR